MTGPLLPAETGGVQTFSAQAVLGRVGSAFGIRIGVLEAPRTGAGGVALPRPSRCRRRCGDTAALPRVPRHTECRRTTGGRIPTAPRRVPAAIWTRAGSGPGRAPADGRASPPHRHHAHSPQPASPALPATRHRAAPTARLRAYGSIARIRPPLRVADHIWFVT